MWKSTVDYSSAEDTGNVAAKFLQFTIHSSSTRSTIMKYLIVLLVLASLAIVGCSDNSSQEPISALSNDTPLPLGKRTPMKMRIVGQSSAPNFSGRCAPAPTFEIIGTGNGTQLGNFIDVQSHCGGAPNQDGSIDFYNGLSTVTAANGDEVYSTYSGKLWPVAGPVYRIDGYAYIVGGTGRFANAIGEQVASGTTNLATGDAVLELDGWIERH
jgi:hypothetical protein